MTINRHMQKIDLGGIICLLRLHTICISLYVDVRKDFMASLAGMGFKRLDFSLHFLILSTLSILYLYYDIVQNVQLCKIYKSFF